MKNRVIATFLLSAFLLGVGASDQVRADNSLSSNGNVTVKDSGKSDIVDPEIPDVVIDPPPGPSTEGSLRFDYVSSLDFGTVKLGTKNRSVNALAVPISNGTKQRGTFVQITDVREGNKGWNLQVKQANQFITSENDELKGAFLSLDKAWANAQNTNNPPTVTRDTLELANIDSAYEVARAETGKGAGIWSIEFGASKDNDKINQSL